MKKILIVDDNDSVLLMLSTILEAGGFQVSTAKNGELGLQLADQIQFDAAIIDLLMPRINGMELARQLQAHAAAQSHRMIIWITSGAVLGQAETAALAAGALEFLPKPFQPSSLIDTLRARFAQPPREFPSSTPAAPAPREDE